MDVLYIRRGGKPAKKKKKRKRGMSGEQQSALARRREEREKRAKLEAEGAAEPKAAKRKIPPVLRAPLDPHHLLEEIADTYNLDQARKRAAHTKGVGVDRMPPPDLLQRIPDISLVREDLLAGTYTPSPVRMETRVTREGRATQVGVLTATDLMVQRAVFQVISKHLEQNWQILLERELDSGWVHRCTDLANGGMIWIGRLGIAGWEDAEEIGAVLGLLRKYVPDERVLRLVGSFLEAERFGDGRLLGRPAGLANAGLLAAVCRRLILRELDGRFESRLLPFVRRDTQMLLFAPNRGEAAAALETVQEVLAGEVRAPLYASYALIQHIGQVKFLGFGFFRQAGEWGARRLPGARDEYRDVHRDPDVFSTIDLPQQFGDDPRTESTDCGLPGLS